MNLNVVKDLDFYHSLALLSIEFNCVRPTLKKDGFIDIKGARNPFISLSRKEGTVPIDISMGTDKNAMIISGPNAGGKTAALKTIGLLCLMAQSGLLIPASESPVVPIFPNIFAVMGDEQDISMELSSFTAHMNTIKDLYALIRGGELVLIDEIGGNTEPQEASALSMGVIDAFVEKGCNVIVTTHLNLLKAYGYTKPFAINVATAFDSDSMTPLYRLLYNSAGYSNAINVAKNIKVPSDIIERSYAYLGKQEHMLNDLVTALELGKRNVEEERRLLIQIRGELQKRLAQVKNKREEFFRKVEERCEARLLEFERELKQVRKELERKEPGAVVKSKQRLKGLRQKFVKSQPMTEDNLAVGDYVKVHSLGMMGHIVGMDKEKEIFELDIGNARARIDVLLLERIPEPREPQRSGYVQIEAELVPAPEINVIGMRAEDALKEVDRFLDRALIQGLAQVTILHGIGTGKLMKAIRDHLGGVNYVRSVKKDEKNAGITIIELS
jgi:DNA mismatch repair protein MutS2